MTKKYIPEDLATELERLVAEHIERRSQYKRKFLLDCKYVCATLLEHKIINKAYKNTEHIKFTSEYCSNVIGSRYTKPILQFLMNHNILDRDNFYLPGSKSYAYQVNKNLILGKTIKFGLPKNYSDKLLKHSKGIDLKNDTVEQIIKKISNRIKTNSLYGDTVSADYMKLIGFLKEIEFDYDAVFKYIEESFKSGKIDNAQKFYYEVSVLKIQDKDFFISIDHKTGRIFTNLTNLFKELKPFLRYKDRNLVEIDITCSQPLFLAKELIPFQKLYNHKGTIHSFISYTQKDLYSHLTKLYNNHFGDNLKRNDIKEMFISFLFQKAHVNRHTKFGQFFKKYFPEVFDIIVMIKQIPNKLKKQHSVLAILLQKNEAEIIINTALDFAKANIPVWTIHDSIITTEENVNKVKTVLEATFDLVDLKPNLRITNLK